MRVEAIELMTTFLHSPGSFSGRVPGILKKAPPRYPSCLWQSSFAGLPWITN